MHCKVGLPAGSKYKPGRQPGSPTGRYTAAGQSTGEEEKKIQLVDGNVMKRQVAEISDVGAFKATHAALHKIET